MDASRTSVEVSTEVFTASTEAASVETPTKFHGSARESFHHGHGSFSGRFHGSFQGSLEGRYHGGFHDVDFSRSHGSFHVTKTSTTFMEASTTSVEVSITAMEAPMSNIFSHEGSRTPWKWKCGSFHHQRPRKQHTMYMNRCRAPLSSWCPFAHFFVLKRLVHVCVSCFFRTLLCSLAIENAVKF